MVIIASRPEYQLMVEPARNRIFYQNFGAMQTATALPHYLADWQAALAEMRPGFDVLSDMQIVNQANPALLHEFHASEQLIAAHGVRMLADVHVPGRPTRRSADDVLTDGAIPVRRFLSIWEAAQFLDYL